MVEIFKTSIEKQKHAIMILQVLSQQFPLFKMNFDLDDCDRILRVEGINIAPEKIIEVLNSSGYHCQLLE